MPSAVHISLNVSDLSKSVEFYRGFLGEPKKLKADYAKFVGSDPEIHLALQPGLDNPKAGPLLPPWNPRRVHGRGAALAIGPQGRGVVSDEEKREACCYALQDKFWLTDPDGNRWEVYTVLEDIEAVTRRSSDCVLRALIRTTLRDHEARRREQHGSL